MAHDPMHHEPEVPPSLAEALRRAEQRAAAGADLSGLDRAVLESASRRLASGTSGSRRRSAVIWRIGGAVAAAAGLALAVYLSLPGTRGNGVTANDRGVAFDSTKPVTILDAFRLARLLEPSTNPHVPALSATWDVTGDGAIDQRDVDAIAARAVRLGGTSDRKGGAT